MDDRRHGKVTYLPLAISIFDLIRQIKERLPEGTKYPSESCVRLQFWPTNPYHKSEVNYTGRFPVKYSVQERLLRKKHIDSKYCAKIPQYMKEMAARFNTETLMLSMDDKCCVPVGEPGQPQSNGVRPQQRSLRLVSVANMTLDHDFHIAGAVPSVWVIIDISKDSKDSFHEGKVYVTVKDKVFQTSTVLRHTVETVKVVREDKSSDGVNSDYPIQQEYTDGGPDHNTTFWTVKIAHVLKFVMLDLDLLVAARTAPAQSYANMAERSMSPLNLALQTVLLLDLKLIIHEVHKGSSRKRSFHKGDI